MGGWRREVRGFFSYRNGVLMRAVWDLVKTEAGRCGVEFSVVNG
jgi:hypothetical protein